MCHPILSDEVLNVSE